MTSTSVLSSLLSLRLANKLSAQGEGTDRKTLVCIFLPGGIDSFNVLVPTDDTRYNEYAASRSNLALPKDDLLPLNQVAEGDGNSYGVHPGLADVQEMFNGLGGDTSKRRLSFVSNVGTLLRPTTIADFNSNSFLPRALFSHIDQIEQWQTAIPQGGDNLTGWAGRVSDLLHDSYNGENSASLSFAGNNAFQVGSDSIPFVVTPSGALSFAGGYDSNSILPEHVKNEGMTDLLSATYTNLVEQAFATTTKNSVDAQSRFQTVFDSFDQTITTSFPGSYIASQLSATLRTIALREALGLRRQTIFVQYGGWDHHGELLETQDSMLRTLGPAMKAFQNGLEELGLQDDVISFTASDFGRTLRSNGRGTDHAWGGNQMIFGGPVNGGRVAGTFPSLALDGADDVGRGGRLLPTTAIDEFFSEMLTWFGVSNSDMTTILPNYGEFTGRPALDLVS